MVTRMDWQQPATNDDVPFWRKHLPVRFDVHDRRARAVKATGQLIPKGERSCFLHNWGTNRT